ncbi:MAG: hypothetical protein J7K46_12210 [Bacteroidales bacterium]|nr:hypothetical protein [Bacteroidales bacterium]
MEYKGKYEVFDASQIKTYPVAERDNKVKLSDLLDPAQVTEMRFDVSDYVNGQISELAGEIVSSRKNGKPVVFFTGAHLIKNGLGKLVADLVHRKVFTLVAGNAATSIHDFELCLFGETSEYVPQALEKGQFGMAFEFNYLNGALIAGNRLNLGYGESVGRMMHDPSFREQVEEILGLERGTIRFEYPEVSVQYACFQENIPMTIHAGIGTDVIDQHVWFDGEAKGGCSGRDFLIYAREITGFTKGGVILNVGSAVTGPEVFLKAASMAGNIGKVPEGIITADFDIRPYDPHSFTNEKSVGYYFRDQKSIVTRVPQAYNGKGMYIGGNQKQTFPLFYKKMVELLG